MATGCVSELMIPTNSASSFAVTAAQTSNCCSTSPDTCIIWTDEKHKLYLNSLEASFVNQLRHYSALCGSLRKAVQHHPKSSRLVPIPTVVCHNTSPQKNVKFERHELLLESTADSHSIQGLARIHHLASSRKRHCATSTYMDRNKDSPREKACIRGNSAVSGGSARSSQQHHASLVRHSDSLDSITEVYDQNFVDDNQVGQSRSIPVAKRLKTVGSNSLRK